MRKFRLFVVVVMLLGLASHLTLTTPALAQEQIAIPRVDLMPNQPTPYQMRDWKTAAMGYDSLVFNMTLEGQYLPLSWSTTTSINYPGEPGFGLVSYVGGDRGGEGEGINTIPAVIGASLVGIDKSDQDGTDYVKMCRHFFNRANGLDLYLNNASGGTGGDWWYETMPNVFFYQLYDLYPSTPDFS
ncbi:MAG: laminin G, partial [bacterium]